jgi:hypothetical protein
MMTPARGALPAGPALEERTYLAGLALSGLCANPVLAATDTAEELADAACVLADALLRRLASGPPATPVEPILRPAACLVCQAPLAQPRSAGRPRQYCSPACRQRASYVRAQHRPAPAVAEAATGPEAV